MAERLRDIALRFADGSNSWTKLSAGTLYELYEPYFEALADKPVTFMELGVYSGESLKTFATYFKNGKVIGVDIEDRGTDFSAFPNAVFVKGDQRDAAGLAAICTKHAPGGIDIILDDASHFGAYSLNAYNALFPFLKSAGLYIVEDWATGYWDDWPDGSRFQEFASDLDGKRIQSHDFGMVGFVKYLVDEVMSIGIRPSATAPVTRPNRLDSMNVHKGAVILKKALDPARP